MENEKSFRKREFEGVIFFFGKGRVNNIHTRGTQKLIDVLS
jgi:hypothetical protein